MLLGTVAILATLAIAFWHYLQGFFSATISAIVAIVAALMAISYHENLAVYFVNWGFPEQAAAISLVLIFACVYFGIRAIFDKLVPGNIRFPLAVNLIGASVMGIIAAIMCVGLLLIAAQTLPFRPSMAMYSHYKINQDDRMVYGIDIDPTHRTQKLDQYVYEDLFGRDFAHAEQDHLFLRQDEAVLWLANHVTADSGSLQGDRALADIHPDYLTELYAQRLGIQIGANHAIVNTETRQPVEVLGFYTVPSLKQIDPELPGVHQGPPLPDHITAGPGQVLLVARIKFSDAARIADAYDSILRLSPGTVRLVAGRTDYYPIGTLTSDHVLLANKIDDPIFVNLNSSDHRIVDFVFVVDGDTVLRADAANAAGAFLADDAFVEVKRYGQVSVGHAVVLKGMVKILDPGDRLATDPNKFYGVMITGWVQAELKGPDHPATPAVAVSPQVPETVAPTPPVHQPKAPAVVGYTTPVVSDRFEAPINVHSGAAEIAELTAVKSVQGYLTQKKFGRLVVSADLTTDQLQEGVAANLIGRLFVPPGSVMLQVEYSIDPNEQDPWAWGKNLPAFRLVDAGGGAHTPAGAWAAVHRDDHPDDEFVVASYDSGGSPAAITPQAGRPTNVWLAFNVPSGTKITQLEYQGKAVMTCDVTAH